MAFQGLLLTAFAVFVFATQQINVGADDTLRVTDVTSASNLFSRNLYTQVAKPGESIVYSPFSIHSALTMTSVGAKGDTLREMRNVLVLPGSTTANIGTAYRDLITRLNSAVQVNLSTSNAIFANPAYTIKDEFTNEIAINYDAMATTFDLSNKEKSPEDVINDYISNKTNHLIKKVLPDGSITIDTLMVLVNTIYFHGLWEVPFDKYGTQKQDFYLSSSSTKEVDMMHRTGDVMYKEDLNRKVEVIELPFKGNKFALYIVLPKEVEGIGEFEDTLSNGVDDLFQNLVYKTLEIALPKFKVETTLHLKDNLRTMGMPTAFSCETADFSGMSDARQFCISSVIHKAVIDVKEDGTTAAAVTTVMMVATGLIINIPSFRADHPFMYFLRDKQTGQILFQGKFTGSTDKGTGTAGYDDSRPSGFESGAPGSGAAGSFSGYESSLLRVFVYGFNLILMSVFYLLY